jgi:hypothetical protein
MLDMPFPFCLILTPSIHFFAGSDGLVTHSGVLPIGMSTEIPRTEHRRLQGPGWTAEPLNHWTEWTAWAEITWINEKVKLRFSYGLWLQLIHCTTITLGIVPCKTYDGRLQISWTHLITPSWNFVEVRWRSLFRSTSLGKRCTSYNAPPTYRKRAADRCHFEMSCVGAPFSWLAQKSHGGEIWSVWRMF